MTYANTSFPHDGGFPGTCRLSLMGRLIDRAVPALQYGRLQLRLPNGDIIERHGSSGGPHAVLRANRWRALWRMLADGESGFSEGYLDGDWSTPALYDLLQLFACNDAALQRATGSLTTSVLRSRLLHRLRSNSRRGSRHNIAAHYDLGNDFFSPWLDAGMNYSSALYAGETTLEAAQDAKLDRIATLLDLSGGKSILEIGCGWPGARWPSDCCAASMPRSAASRYRPNSCSTPERVSHVNLAKGSPTCACWITAMLPENSTASRRSR